MQFPMQCDSDPLGPLIQHIVTGSCDHRWQRVHRILPGWPSNSHPLQELCVVHLRTVQFVLPFANCNQEPEKTTIILMCMSGKRCKMSSFVLHNTCSIQSISTRFIRWGSWTQRHAGSMSVFGLHPNRSDTHTNNSATVVQAPSWNADSKHVCRSSSSICPVSLKRQCRNALA